jgi:hypothetical protein
LQPFNRFAPFKTFPDERRFQWFQMFHWFQAAKTAGFNRSGAEKPSAGSGERLAFAAVQR